LGNAVAYADVTGSFQVAISLTPSSCVGFVCEKELFTVAVESRLRLALTLGGAAFELDGSMGITGPQFTVLDFQLDLGVRLKNRLILAVPFGRAKMATGERIPVAVPPGDLLLVRQEESLEYLLSGVLLSSLFVTEDLDFPSPLAAPRKSYSGDNQRFGLGAAFTLSSKTPNGTRVKSVTRFCLDLAKRKNIIKRSFAGRVCEEGKLHFAGETITIEDLAAFAGIQTDHEITCLPQAEDPPLECTWESQVDTQKLPVLLVISTELLLNKLLSSGTLQKVELRTAYGPLMAEFTWNGMLALQRVDAAFDVPLAAWQERLLKWRLSGTFLSDSGFTRLKSALTLRQGQLMSQADITFSKSDGLLQFTEASWQLAADIGPIDLELLVVVAHRGLRELAARTSVQF